MLNVVEHKALKWANPQCLSRVNVWSGQVFKLYSHLFCRGFMFYLRYRYQTRFPYQMVFVPSNSNRRVSNVEPVLLTIAGTQVHPRFFGGFCVARSLNFCVVFWWSLFVVLSVLLVVVLSLFLRFMASGYLPLVIPFSIFWLPPFSIFWLPPFSIFWLSPFSIFWLPPLVSSGYPL